MAERAISGSDVVAYLERLGYYSAGTFGNHAILKYQHPETEKIRIVTIPLFDRLAPTVVENIADQAGAGDVEEFREMFRP